ncbi:PREDICTED: auxin-induced protein 22D-like [Ipomoea nil]|uniref:auxin-induced protein 22D-like n=1 Tax=Ipomoea nil TaxID=35883 RepID=UPI000901A3CD|nr:PREDICTED: auxin-induced protein 22D-like [Ipomoea nil]
MERAATYDNDDLNLKATELRLGLPGTDEPERETSQNSRTKKRSSSEMGGCSSSDSQDDPAPATKTQVVGWPPVRSYRKNVIQAHKSPETTTEMGGGIYVKVSMDGAPYLRKMDLNVYKSYPDLVKGLEKMFKCSSNICVYSEREGNMNNGSDYAPTYEDKDGDWMLAGDVPWEMFVNNCKRLRLMKLKDLKLKA